jgi:pimeloyl-ACP methyl ester carboxylesterase
MTEAPAPGPVRYRAQRAGFSLPVRVSGTGVPMIFLHGLGSDSRDSVRDLGALPGLRQALADQRGHGHARPPVAAGQFDLDDLADDLAAMIATLGWICPVVGGGSMGAAVALRYAQRNPHEWTALVLVAPALGPGGGAAGGLLGGVADRIEAVGLAGAVAELRGRAGAGAARAPAPPEPADPTAGEPAGDGPGDPMAPWLRQNPASLAVAMRAVGTWRPFTSFAELSALRKPAVIIGIQGDPLHPAELASTFHASLPGSRLEILPSVAAASRPGAIGAAVLRGLTALGIVHQPAVKS